MIENNSVNLHEAIIPETQKINLIKQSIASLSKEINASTKELTVLEGALLDRQSQLDILVASQSETSILMDQVREHIESTKSEITKLNESIQSLSNEEQDLDLTLSADRTPHLQQINKHKMDMNAKEKLVHEFNDDILPYLQSQHTALITQLESLHAQQASLQNTATGNAAKIAELTTHIALLQKYIAEVQSTVTTQKAKNDAVESAMREELHKASLIADTSQLRESSSGMAKNIESCLAALAEVQRESEVIRYLVSNISIILVYALYLLVLI
jgi:peptidoglycan hydrolase CwlO-like protein